MKGINEKASDIKRNNFGSNVYVSYRDSRFTEILSEYLEGNSKTYIIEKVSTFRLIAKIFIQLCKLQEELWL